MFAKRKARSVWTDLALGAAAGLVATAIMGPAMERIQKYERKSAREKEKRIGPAEPGVEKVARKLTAPLGLELTGEKKRKAGMAVHYGYGIFWGGLFGALHPRLPGHSIVRGLAFGTAVGVLGELVLLPVFRLAPPAWRYPIDTHAAGLAAHLVYGAAAEGALTYLQREM